MDDRISDLIERLGVADAAAHLGVSPRAVAMWRRGETGPQAVTLRLLDLMARLDAECPAMARAVERTMGGDSRGVPKRLAVLGMDRHALAKHLGVAWQVSEAWREGRVARTGPVARLLDVMDMVRVFCPGALRREAPPTLARMALTARSFARLARQDAIVSREMGRSAKAAELEAKAEEMDAYALTLEARIAGNTES